MVELHRFVLVLSNGPQIEFMLIMLSRRGVLNVGFYFIELKDLDYEWFTP